MGYEERLPRGEYPTDFVADVKEAFPDWGRPHYHLDHNSLWVDRYLDDARHVDPEVAFAALQGDPVATQEVMEAHKASRLIKRLRKDIIFMAMPAPRTKMDRHR